MAWVCQEKPLYGSRKELARLCDCSVGSIERWTRLLVSWGWILPKSHYKPRAGGGYTQQANSYAPGLLLRMALAAERRQRAQRALKQGRQGGLQPLRPVVSPLRGETEQLPARDRAPAPARVEGAPAVPADAAPGGRTARLSANGSSSPPRPAAPTTGSAGGKASEGKGFPRTAAGDGLETARQSAHAALGDVFDPEADVRAHLDSPPPRGFRGERAQALAELAELPAEETARAALQLMLSFAGGAS